VFIHQGVDVRLRIEAAVHAEPHPSRPDPLGLAQEGADQRHVGDVAGDVLVPHREAALRVQHRRDVQLRQRREVLVAPPPDGLDAPGVARYRRRVIEPVLPRRPPRPRPEVRLLRVLPHGGEHLADPLRRQLAPQRVRVRARPPAESRCGRRSLYEQVAGDRGDGIGRRAERGGQVLGQSGLGGQPVQKMGGSAEQPLRRRCRRARFRRPVWRHFAALRVHVTYEPPALVARLLALLVPIFLGVVHINDARTLVLLTNLHDISHDRPPCAPLCASYIIYHDAILPKRFWAKS